MSIGMKGWVLGMSQGAALHSFLRYGIVYKATNTLNGKVYVGQTIQTLSQRQQAHRTLTYCRLFHRALMKHGFEAFQWEILAQCPSRESLDKIEEAWIAKLQANHPAHGYNIKSGGYGNGKHAESTKLVLSKIAKAQNRRPPINPMKDLSIEARARQSRKYGGKPFECRTRAGECIGIFVSLRHAATTLHLQPHHIRNNLKRRTSLCSGYVFTYLPDPV
jgi:hypothetical protein